MECPFFSSMKFSFLMSVVYNRLLAAPVIVEGNEKKTSQANLMSASVAAASIEVLECLVDKKTPSQTASVEYVDVSRTS
jgi:hypothetical protein